MNGSRRFFESGQDETPWDDFEATYWSIKENVPAEKATYWQRIGAWIAMDDPADEEKLRRALEERRPVHSIIDAAVGVVREAAKRPAAAGTIGTELNSAVLPAERVNVSLAEGITLQVGFHPDGASHAMRGPNHLISTNEAQLAIADPTIAADDPATTPPMAVRKVGRNKPCPCGSEKKYKKCCGA